MLVSSEKNRKGQYEKRNKKILGNNSNHSNNNDYLYLKFLHFQSIIHKRQTKQLR